MRRQPSIPNVETLISREFARRDRWGWAQPGETLLEGVFTEERQRRAEIVDTPVAAGFPGSPADLTRLVGHPWNTLLRPRLPVVDPRRHGVPRVRRMLTAGTEHARRLGVEVYNCNPESALDAFTKVAYEWALAR